MTWARGTLTEPAGSNARDGVLVTCDVAGCHSFEILGAHGGNAEKLQRLLLKRGWDFTDVVGGARDLCPDHTEAS